MSARLESRVDRPFAVALSGGGDSIALLRLAADWARANGRRLLALTVDHGLSPDSAAWTHFAEGAACAVGADWRGLSWSGRKPATGLPAAARMARHRLIADAARAADVRVILFAHTADDIAEAEIMRAGGSTLGRLRDWSPSPAWPEGRGQMLLRPMLAAGRGAVRTWLEEQGADWIEDPGNEDPKYGRSRARMARRALEDAGPEGRIRPGGEGGGVAHGPSPLAPLRKPAGFAAVQPGDRAPEEGTIRADRQIDAATLPVVLVCAGGGDQRPRGDRLATLLVRLRAGQDFTATLSGARIEARADQVLITREAGEFARRPCEPLPLFPGVETVWDGRWAITIDTSGWSVVPAAGRMAALSARERAVLKSFSPAARGSMPVLIRNDGTAPVLAGRAARAVSLVEARLALALDRMTHERDLGDALHGASPRNHLFSG